MLQTFSVNLSIGQRERPMAADIYIDGQSFTGKPLYAGLALSTTISGVATSDSTEKPFAFSPLELTGVYSVKLLSSESLKYFL